MRLQLIVAGLVLSAAPLAATAAPTTTVTDVPTARGTIRIAHYRPDVPLANLYAMSGGDGVLRLRQDGSGIGDNFAFSPVMRNRQALLDAGYSVIMIDAPSDMQASPGIPFAHRVTAAHAAELLEVLRAVQQRDKLPAWMMGFSAGGPSVANLAINAPRSTSFGLVLLSPNTGFAQHLLTLNREPPRSRAHRARRPCRAQFPFPWDGNGAAKCGNHRSPESHGVSSLCRASKAAMSRS